MDIMKVAVLVLPGVLDLSLGITLDVMTSANRLRNVAGLEPLFEFSLVGTGRRRERSGAGMEVGLLGRMSDQLRPDLLVLPGANRVNRAELGPWLDSVEVARAGAWVREVVAGGAHLAASCVSTFALAQSGVLDGHAATTSWWLAPFFRERFPHVDLDMDRMVVSDGPISTAGAALAHADLMLALVARWGSDELARNCARYLMLDHRVTQSRYAIPTHVARQSPLLQKADRWIQAHLAEPMTLARLADALHMTPRTLARHFSAAIGMSPIQYVQRLRLERATLLLETGSEPLDVVAARVGYADASMLRKLLLRERGVTPGMVRPRRTRTRTA